MPVFPAEILTKLKAVNVDHIFVFTASLHWRRKIPLCSKRYGIVWALKEMILK